MKKYVRMLICAITLFLVIGIITAHGLSYTIVNTSVGTPEVVEPLNPHDQNGNKIDDLIDLSTEQLHDIFVDYDIHPNQTHIDALNGTIFSYGGNVSSVYWYIDTIAARNVPQLLISTIAGLPNVKTVWMQPQVQLFLNVSARAVQARYSSEYSDQYLWMRGGDLGDNITQGENITIAVMDTGVDDEHEALVGKFLGGFDARKFEDTDGDGDDDVYAIPGGPEYEPADGSTNPDDLYAPIFHGTHCASTAMGDPPDGVYVGVAPRAKLVDIRVLSALGSGSTDDVIEGVEWATKMRLENKFWNSPNDPWNAYSGIDVLSVSLGSTEAANGTDPLCRAVDNAVNAGIVVVVAAGNEGSDNTGLGSPAAADLAITVAAIDDNGTIDRSDDTIADFSSRGPRDSDGDSDPYDELKPEVAAPGVDIMAAKGAIGNASNQYQELNGTSMATPHVSGVVALVLSHYENVGMDLTPQQVDEILRSTAEDKDGNYNPSLSPTYDIYYGWGIVSAYWAAYVHDVAVVDVTPYPTSATQGDLVYVNVTVENHGDFPGKNRAKVSEIFDVSVYKSMWPTLIGTISGVTLAPETTRTLTFTWNTSTAIASTYEISAKASVVPLEFDTADNALSDGTVRVWPPPVGGTRIPIDTLRLVAPYVCAISIAAIAAVAVATHAKRARLPPLERGKERGR